jgi:hypothetical protein
VNETFHGHADQTCVMFAETILGLSQPSSPSGGRCIKFHVFTRRFLVAGAIARVSAPGTEEPSERLRSGYGQKGRDCLLVRLLCVVSEGHRRHFATLYEMIVDSS